MFAAGWTSPVSLMFCFLTILKWFFSTLHELAGILGVQAGD